MSSQSSDCFSVAVVVPVYNVAKYLPECLDSLLRQTHRNFTVFCVDDGSTDGSGDILDAYAAKDSRILALHKSNGGVSSARNLALDLIEESSFDGICFIDSDDYVKPNFLQHYVDTALTENADYVVCAWDMFDRDGLIKTPRSSIPPHPSKLVDINEAFDHYLKRGHWSKLKSKSFSPFAANTFFAADTIRGLRFSTTLRRAEDQEFRLRAMTRIHRGVITSDVTYMYRLRASSLSHSGNDITDDLRYAMSLLDHLDEFPSAGKKTIEFLVLKHWWLCTCFSFADGTFPKNQALLSSAYQRISSHRFQSDVLKEFRGKLRLFAMGEWALRLYMSFRKTKKPHSSGNPYP